GRTVLVRADFNVPMKDDEITDDNRIVQALPTIKYIIEQGGKVVLFSHLGKVKEESDKAELTLKPVANALAEKLNKDVAFVPETRGTQLEQSIKALNEGDVLLVENTRFE
ncbi:phosphoglycerate kinase, partial [Mesorhizobium sp. M1C.F.Ca.ET.188.01.1.1]